MRASWKGYFRIGDVMMPVRLYAATRSTAPRFVQLHAEDHSPVQRVTICMKDGEEVTDGDIVRAAEYEGGYVELSETDLERHISFERDIVIRQITEVKEIDPIYYDTPYYLAPDRGGELAYSILRRAFEKTSKVAIATFLFYGRERLGMVSSQEGMLQLQILRFYEEIVPRSEVRTPMLPQPSPAQIAVASRLFEHYNLPFHASDFRNQQVGMINELIERKAKGLPLKRYEPVASGATPENEVVTRMKQMLGEDPRVLRS
jgi:DNA end-binding protein Ku